ncbi:hypothetical protein Hanom_Chr12g01156891 [Helianthus anomalus]
MGCTCPQLTEIFNQVRVKGCRVYSLSTSLSKSIKKPNSQTQYSSSIFSNNIQHQQPYK